MQDLSRGRENANSQAAFKFAKESASYHHQRILELIVERGSLTLKEYCRISGKEKGEVSGRFTELAEMKRIKQDKTLPRREGCGIWVKVVRP